MKLIKRTFAFLAVASTLISCGDDDKKNNIIIPGPPIGVEVKYEVSVTADMITKISYRMGDGTTFFGQLDPDGSPLLWEESLVALYTNMPETAFLEVKCRNTSGTVKTVTLNFYRGEELVETITSPVAPADADDQIEDDIVTTTLTKTFDE